MQIITLLFSFTVHKYIYPPVSKVHAGSFCVSIIHRTLTWTIGSLTCVRDYSYACVYTQGLGTPTASQHIFDSEKLTNCSCAPDADGARTSDLLDLESNALPTEPPRFPETKGKSGIYCVGVLGNQCINKTLEPLSNFIFKLFHLLLKVPVIHATFTHTLTHTDTLCTLNAPNTSFTLTVNCCHSLATRSN